MTTLTSLQASRTICCSRPPGNRISALTAVSRANCRNDVSERRVGFQPGVTQRCIPYETSSLPGVPAHLGGSEVEGLVRDAGVDVHATVIVDGVDEVVHVRWLPVPFESGPRLLHGAQRFSPARIRPDALPDQPVSILGSLFALVILLDQGAVHVGDGLVERSRLVLIDELRLFLRDAVGQLMAHYVYRNGKAVEQHPVAVSEDHALPVP